MSTNPRPVAMIETISPEKAAKWLATSNGRNRPMIKTNVERIAEDIKEGRFMLTHQGIAFDTDGVIVDGQNRLAAVVKAGSPVEMFVFRNLSPEARLVVDEGVKRTVYHTCHLIGEDGLRTVSRKETAIARCMMAGPQSGDANLITRRSVIDFMVRHKDAILFSFDGLASASGRGIGSAIVASVISRAYYTMDRSALKKAMRIMCDGMPESDDDRIIVILRNFLMIKGDHNNRREVIYYKTERAIQAYCTGEKLNKLYQADEELFPIPGEEK